MIRSAFSIFCTLHLLLAGATITYAADSGARQRITVEAVLEKMAMALGGRDRLARVASIHNRIAVEAAGLKGEVETLTTSGGQSRQHVKLGSISDQLTVFDGKNGWIRDTNGKVRPLADTEIQSIAGSTYTSNFSFLVPGRAHGTPELLGEDPGHYLVKIPTPVGAAVVLHVDKQTFLPVKGEQMESGQAQTTTFEDWREVDGIKLAFRSRQTTGDAKYDVLLTVVEARINDPVGETAFAKPAEQADDFRFASGKSATGIPFELTANHIYLRASVNGSEPLWFLFDTGAERSVINMSRAKTLGLKLEGAVEARGTGSGSLQASFVPNVSLSVQGVEVLGQTIVSIPLDGLSPFEGRALDGILGYDFASRFVVEIDYANSKISFHDPKAYSHAGPGDRIPFALDGNIPRIQAEVVQPGQGSLKGSFMIDTGSRNALMLHSPTVRNTAWVRQLAESSIRAPHGIGVGGIAKTTVGRLGILKIGKFAVENLVTGFSFDEKGVDSSGELLGNIGAEVLRRFKVVFDYSRQEMILEPNANLGEPFEYDMLGVLLMLNGTNEAGYRVIRVIDGSSAKDAGLAEGDVILSIDGRSTSSWTLDQAKRFFREHGREVRLTVQRQKETREVVLKLKRMV